MHPAQNQVSPRSEWAYQSWSTKFGHRTVAISDPSPKRRMIMLHQSSWQGPRAPSVVPIQGWSGDSHKQTKTLSLNELVWRKNVFIMFPYGFVFFVNSPLSIESATNLRRPITWLTSAHDSKSHAKHHGRMSVSVSF